MIISMQQVASLYEYIYQQFATGAVKISMISASSMDEPLPFDFQEVAPNVAPNSDTRVHSNPKSPSSNSRQHAEG